MIHYIQPGGIRTHVFWTEGRRDDRTATFYVCANGFNRRTETFKILEREFNFPRVERSSAIIITFYM